MQLHPKILSFFVLASAFTIVVPAYAATTVKTPKFQNCKSVACFRSAAKKCSPAQLIITMSTTTPGTRVSQVITNKIIGKSKDGNCTYYVTFPKIDLKFDSAKLSKMLPDNLSENDKKAIVTDFISQKKMAYGYARTEATCKFKGRGFEDVFINTENIQSLSLTTFLKNCTGSFPKKFLKKRIEQRDAEYKRILQGGSYPTSTMYLRYFIEETKAQTTTAVSASLPPNYPASPQQMPVTEARDARRLTDLKQIQTALELFYTDMGKYPTNTQLILGSSVASCLNSSGFAITGCVNPYMGRVPSDLLYGYIYDAGGDGTTYTVKAKLERDVGGGALKAGNIILTPSGLKNE